MKNYLKLSIVSAILIISTSVFSQEPVKKETKQEPKKEKKDTKASKKDSASDTTKSGTRMAINEQGMPNKKNKTKATTTATKAEPASTPAPKDK